MAGPEGEWNLGILQPSQFMGLRIDGIESTQSEIQRLTRQIIQEPYNIDPRFLRGKGFFKLGYPELALGDLHKALLLVQAAQTPESRAGATALLLFCRNTRSRQRSSVTMDETADFWARQVDELKLLETEIWKEHISALESVLALRDAAQMVREGQRKFTGDDWFSQTLSRLENDLETLRALGSDAVEFNGVIYPRPYPWMTDDVLNRDDQVVKAIQDDFARACSSCTVSPSPFLLASPANGQANDCLGVVASKNIDRNEVVFVEDGILHATSAPNRCPTCARGLSERIGDGFTIPCCGIRFCSATCIEKADEVFHKPICGRDFSFLFPLTEAAFTPLDPVLMLRILAASIQEGASHPLKSRTVARYKANYASRGTAFNFADRIIKPNRVLLTLGIDIFADPRYDTWVLETIQHRIENNSTAGELDETYPLVKLLRGYPMLNHSCEPNVNNFSLSADEHGKSSRNAIAAIRDIEKGEELFLCFFEGNPETMSRADRQSALFSWLEGECGCTRCEREKMG